MSVVPSVVPLSWVDEIGSTQDVLAARAARGADPQALATTSQTTGRGRRGREWSCAPGAGLAVSVLIRPQRQDGWTWLPLLGGLAVVEALEGLGAPGLSLKWPNDVLADGAKLVGLLAERVDRPAQMRPGFVLGIGVNLQATGAPDGAAALDRLGADADPTHVAEAVLARLGLWLGRWERSEESLFTGYRDRCGTLGQQVRVSLPGNEVAEGRAEGIDDDGRLVLRSASGQHVALSAGDVVHLRPQ